MTLPYCTKDGLLEVSKAKREYRSREFTTADTPQPRIAILGTSPFTTLLTNAGGGQTRFGPIAVTRWRSDPTLDDSGHWCYIRDLDSGATWSAAHQPTCSDPEWYKASFEEDCVSFQRRDGEIETLTEIVVASHDAVEIRKITLTNSSAIQREIELTSCTEVVIAPFAVDRGHPVFSNLFVQTEWIEESQSILAMRRPRSAVTQPVWCGHTLCVLGADAVEVSCETDRGQFIGRGRTYRHPLAMDRNGALSGRVGAVLDPVFSIRARISIPAGKSASMAFASFMGRDRENTLHLARRFHDSEDVSRLFASARSASNEPPGALYQELAGLVLFPDSISAQVTGGRNELRQLGIGGELPVVVATIESTEGEPALAELLKIHRYWRSKGVRCDLVVLADDVSASVENRIIEANTDAATLDDVSTFEHPGVVVLHESRELNPLDIDTLRSNARLVIDCETFDLEKLLDEKRSPL